MFEIVLVTSRKLCPTDFLGRIELIAQQGPKAIMLREKDLLAAEYFSLADKVNLICQKYQIRFIVHNYLDKADELRPAAIHLPINLGNISPNNQKTLKLLKTKKILLGYSVHSEEEAQKAVNLEADYLTFGHVFETDCKKDLPGRGLALLSRIIAEVPIPVYAIGGINESNIADIKKCGSAGAFIMSSFMTAKDPGAYLSTLKSLTL